MLARLCGSTPGTPALSILTGSFLFFSVSLIHPKISLFNLVEWLLELYGLQSSAQPPVRIRIVMYTNPDSAFQLSILDPVGIVRILRLTMPHFTGT